VAFGQRVKPRRELPHRHLAHRSHEFGRQTGGCRQEVLHCVAAIRRDALLEGELASRKTGAPALSARLAPENLEILELGLDRVRRRVTGVTAPAALIVKHGEVLGTTLGETASGGIEGPVLKRATDQDERRTLAETIEAITVESCDVTVCILCPCRRLVAPAMASGRAMGIR
jgi:hypothetical protein